MAGTPSTTGHQSVPSSCQNMFLAAYCTAAHLQEAAVIAVLCHPLWREEGELYDLHTAITQPGL